MHKITVIALKGYREWTESLGARREHIIQKTQARLQAALWDTFTAVGALPHHFRYDFFIALTTNVDNALVARAVDKVAKKSPVPVEHCSGTGETPYAAYLNCGKTEGEDGGLAAVAHIDIVNSTDITTSDGPLKVYVEILGLLNQLAKRCKEVGCLSFYLGGDNVAIFLPRAQSIHEVVEELPVKVRAGVGVAKKPYNAFVKATKALDYLRTINKVGIKLVE